jgi:hypothetical protein
LLTFSGLVMSCNSLPSISQTGGITGIYHHTGLNCFSQILYHSNEKLNHVRGKISAFINKKNSDLACVWNDIRTTRSI